MSERQVSHSHVSSIGKDLWNLITLNKLMVVNLKLLVSHSNKCAVKRHYDYMRTMEKHFKLINGTLKMHISYRNYIIII
jgi:hypothetical protein